MNDNPFQTALSDLMTAYAACNGEDHPAYEGAEKLLARTIALPPSTQEHGRDVQALLNSLDRTAVAKIVDPSAWINEDGNEIEQDHSDSSLHVADQIITYVLQKARSLPTTEGQTNG